MSVIYREIEYFFVFRHRFCGVESIAHVLLVLISACFFVIWIFVVIFAP